MTKAHHELNNVFFFVCAVKMDYIPGDKFNWKEYYTNITFTFFCTYNFFCLHLILVEFQLVKKTPNITTWFFFSPVNVGH